MTTPLTPQERSAFYGAAVLGLRALAARKLTWEDAARLVDSNQRSRVSKFQPCLPPDIEHGLIARETMNVDDANATLAQWKRAPTQEVEG
ncbi:hypothetical protein [Archangium sp.]|uniref:hypothetical protein n=1 Tax=Archangium sp. TaxID=1872627 RepID=UPI002D6D4B44|nr:hypothetical protein [Archangium sp.]HYO55922.1 hypothetical protein [Archangium sp.]